MKPATNSCPPRAALLLKVACTPPSTSCNGPITPSLPTKKRAVRKENPYEAVQHHYARVVGLRGTLHHPVVGRPRDRLKPSPPPSFHEVHHPHPRLGNRHAPRAGRAF